MKKSIAAVAIFISIFQTPVFAQGGGSSPELIQITKSAGDFLAKRDFDNAAAMYTQAIRMAPNNVALRRDLAYTYFLKKDFDKAKEIITPVVNSPVADEQTFQIASAIESALNNTNKAKRILNTGLEKYPNSGLLFNAKGNILAANSKNNSAALKEWNKGMVADPTYPINYYNASKAYFENGDMMWAILYGETYVNLEPYNIKTREIKKIIYDAYQKVFAPDNYSKIPEFSENNTQNKAKITFKSAFYKVMNANISTISDGFNIDNLTMLRTRFVINWNKNYESQLRFSLFEYHTRLIKNGYFSAYNQWLFGATENSKMFGMWVDQHSEKYKKFELWLKNNPYRPHISDEKPE